MRRFLMELAAIAACAAPVGAQQPVLLDEAAEGAVEIVAETRLVIREIPGELSLRAGEPGQIYFSSSSLNGEEEPMPIALWSSGDSIEIALPRGSGPSSRRLVVSVPAELGIRVEGSRAEIDLVGLGGPVSLEGTRLDVTASFLGGPLTVDLRKGSMSLSHAYADVTVRGRDVTAVMEHPVGDVYVVVSGGSVRVARAGNVHAELAATTLNVDGAGGFLRVRMSGGRAELSGVSGGADLELDGTPLEMTSSRGSVRLETNARARLSGTSEISLRATQRGSSLEIQRNKGSVDVSGAGGSVILEACQGDVAIQGRELDVQVLRHGGAVDVQTMASGVRIQSILGIVKVYNDAGDVEIRHVSGDLDVHGGGGSVELTDLSHPLRLVSDALDTRVAWSHVPVDGESSIEASGRMVTIVLPQDGGCRLSAESSYGLVETDLSWLRVSDDRSRASGASSLGGNHEIRVKAAGDVLVTFPGSPFEEQGPGPGEG